MERSVGVADEHPPAAFEFTGSWPFTGTVTVNGHPLSTVSAWDIRATPDGIPVVTLTLVGPGALSLILGAGAAKTVVSDETREALESLGWTPPK
jgi:hypothetical protein